MRQYCFMLKKIFNNENIKFEILYPKIFLNKLKFKSNLITKYLAYIDNYLIFGIYLLYKINKKDIAHICDQANSLLFFFIRTKKIIITCHDVLNMNLNFKKEIKKIKFTGKIYQKLILFSLSKYKYIICVSKKTKKELSKLINTEKKNIKVIYHTLNQNFFPNKLKNKKLIIKNNKIDYKYFLHVGGNNWYKNKLGLIDIFYEFKKLKKNNKYKLILAGKKITYDLEKKIKKLNLKKSIINLINLDLKDIRSLYSNAEALVFPSISEGFGWPIIEAQACGCPVFTYKIQPMSEIGSNSVYYLTPNNPSKSSKIIDKKINFSKGIIKKGFKNLNRFKFKTISKEYINFYKTNSMY